MERLRNLNVVTRIGTVFAFITTGVGLSRSVAVPPENGDCMIGQRCPSNGDLSRVNWPIVSYENGCELYPTYTEAALKALNERRKEQGLVELPVEAMRPDAKPGEDGYVDPNAPISTCGAPEVKSFRFIGWYGDEWNNPVPLYEPVDTQDSK